MYGFMLTLMLICEGMSPGSTTKFGKAAAFIARNKRTALGSFRYARRVIPLGQLPKQTFSNFSITFTPACCNASISSSRYQIGSGKESLSSLTSMWLPCSSFFSVRFCSGVTCRPAACCNFCASPATFLTCAFACAIAALALSDALCRFLIAESASVVFWITRAVRVSVLTPSRAAASVACWARRLRLAPARLLMLLVFTVAANSMSSATISNSADHFSIERFQRVDLDSLVKSATNSPMTPSVTPAIAQYSTPSQNDADATPTAMHSCARIRLHHGSRLYYPKAAWRSSCARGRRQLWSYPLNYP